MWKCILTGVALCLVLGMSGVSVAQVSSYQYSTAMQPVLAQSAGATVLGQGVVLDEQNYTTPIGFDFPFNGARYSSLNVSANGWVWFGAASPAPRPIYGGPLRVVHSTGGAGIIAVFGTDLRGTAASTIFTRISGTAPNRTFTVQWQNVSVAVPTGTSPATFTAEAVLSENGVIRLNFGAGTLAQNATVQSQIGLRGANTNDYVLRVLPFFAQNSCALFDFGATQNIASFVSAFPRNTSFVFTPPATAAPTTFSISGRCTIGNGAPGSGVPVFVNNVQRAVCDGQGFYTVSGLANGSYTVQIQAFNIVFAPAQTAVTIANANRAGVDFNAPGGALTMSTTLVNQNPLNGVSFRVQRSTVFNRLVQAPPFSNSTFATGLADGTYIVTPILAGYRFTPSSLATTVVNANFQTLPTFIGAVAPPMPPNALRVISIPGVVLASYLDNNNVSLTSRLANVGVRLFRVPSGRIQDLSFQTSEVVGTQFTDAQGNYNFTNVPVLSATELLVLWAEPSVGFPAVPYVANTASTPLITNSFTALRGQVRTTAGAPLQGVKITMSNGRTVETDRNGMYLLTEQPQTAQQTATPTIGNLGYTFAPATASVVMRPGRVTEQNFTVTLPSQMQSGFGAPIILAPNNGAILEPPVSNNVAYYQGLTWSGVPEAATYQIQFSASSAFHVQSTSFYALGAETSWLYGSTILPTAAGTQIFWRVRAVRSNGETSAFSETRSFLARIPPPLPALPSTLNLTSGFDPLQHGFNFRNFWETGAVWVPEYYGSVNYANAPYSTYSQNNPTFRAIASARFPNRTSAQAPQEPTYLWDDNEIGFARAGSVYVRNNGVQTPTTNAVDNWRFNTVSGGVVESWGGSCGGFARASVLSFAGVYNRALPYTTPVSNSLRRLIHSHQMYQNFGDYAVSGKDNPTTTVQKLRAAFEEVRAGNRLRQPVISIYDDRSGGGHAVVPYRIVSGTVNGRVVDSVYVYDPNWPDRNIILTKAIVVDRATNSWQYLFQAPSNVWRASGRGFTISAYASQERPITLPERPILAALQSTDDEGFEATPQRSTIRFNSTPEGNAQSLVTVTNQFGSIRNDKDPFGDDNAFPGAYPVQVQSGLWDSKLPSVSGYSLPRELADNLNISYRPAQANAPNSLAFNSGDRFSARADWTAADTRGQGMNIDVPNEVVRFTSNSTVPEATLTFAKLDETKADWENLVRITLRGMMAGDSLTTNLINDGRSVLIESNSGAASGAKNYDISFSRGVGQTFERLALNPNETHTFVIENWDNIAQSGVVQLLDTNKDNRTDIIRTLRVATSVRAVSDNDAFGVAVFPNPASSLLTVQFALPEAAQVQAEIVNLLGQQVMALPLGLRTAGTHSYSALVESLPSGAYLLRIRAGNATVTKPVQIIK